MSSVADARRKLRELLADMDALKPYADPGTPEAAPFVEAFGAARDAAIEAARAYKSALDDL